MNGLRGPCLPLAVMLALFSGASAAEPASETRPHVTAPIAQTKETQAAITPQVALQMLKEGNERFTSGTMRPRDLRQQVKATASAQYPFASILACVDSRSPPELVFDQGIGDIFSARIAGNFVDDDILGSLEF